VKKNNFYKGVIKFFFLRIVVLRLRFDHEHGWDSLLYTSPLSTCWKFICYIMKFDTKSKHLTCRYAETGSMT